MEFLFDIPPFLPSGVTVALSFTGSDDGVVDGLKSESMSCGREERGRPFPTVRTESRRGICLRVWVFCCFFSGKTVGVSGGEVVVMAGRDWRWGNEVSEWEVVSDEIFFGCGRWE